MKKDKRIWLLLALIAIFLIIAVLPGRKNAGSEGGASTSQQAQEQTTEMDGWDDTGEAVDPEDEAWQSNLDVGLADEVDDSYEDTGDAWNTGDASEEMLSDEAGEYDTYETDASDDVAAMQGQGDEWIDEDGEYTSKDEVALYIHLYGHLPDNYLTKKEAKASGWDSGKGNLDKVLPGMSIGGDRFGNYEGLLPEASGRKYFECDIDYDGGRRNAKRIVFSNDGYVFYTDDHYETFEELYAPE